MQSEIHRKSRQSILQMAADKQQKFRYFKGDAERSVLESLAAPPLLGDRVPYELRVNPESPNSFRSKLTEWIGDLDFHGAEIALHDNGFTVSTLPVLWDRPKSMWWELNHINFPAFMPEDMEIWGVEYPEGFLVDPLSMPDRREDKTLMFSFMQQLEDDTQDRVSEKMLETRNKYPDFKFGLQPFIVPIWSADAQEAELWDDGCYGCEPIVQFEGQIHCKQHVEVLRDIIEELRHIETYYGNIY